MNYYYDIAVIGGGPAGSTVSFFLAKAGFKVCLLEKKEFPREILCGEFLSKEVFEILDQMNIQNEFLELKPNKINTFNLISETGIQMKSSLGFTAFGMKRGKFDEFLIQNAIKSGVKVFQPYDVKNIIRESDEIFLLAEGSENIEIRAKNIICAYGKQNILDKKLNRKHAESKSKLNGLKYHFDKYVFNELSENEIQLFLGEGVYCGVNKVDEDKVTVCMLEDRTQNLESLPKELPIDLSKQNIAFKNIFSNSLIAELQKSNLYGTGNIYFGKKELVKDGIFFIGDSARVIAPLAGDGIGMAMQSAILLADIFVYSKINKLSDIDTQKLYKKKWRKLFIKRLLIALLIQKLFLSNYLKKRVLAFIKKHPNQIQKIIRFTRG